MSEITKGWKIALTILAILFGVLFLCLSPVTSEVLLTPVTEEEYALLQEYALGTARTFNTEELEKAGINVTTNITQEELQVTVNKQCAYVHVNYPVLSNTTEIKDGVVYNITSYDLDNGNYTRYQKGGIFKIYERTASEMAENWVIMIILAAILGIMVAFVIYAIFKCIYAILS